MPESSNSPAENTDPKEQMKAALERKKRTQAANQGKAGDRPGAAGKTDTHARGGKREFRRKSG